MAGLGRDALDCIRWGRDAWQTHSNAFAPEEKHIVAHQLHVIAGIMKRSGFPDEALQVHSEAAGCCHPRCENYADILVQMALIHKEACRFQEAYDLLVQADDDSVPKEAVVDQFIKVTIGMIVSELTGDPREFYTATELLADAFGGPKDGLKTLQQHMLKFTAGKSLSDEELAEGASVARDIAQHSVASDAPRDAIVRSYLLAVSLAIQIKDADHRPFNESDILAESEQFLDKASPDVQQEFASMKRIVQSRTASAQADGPQLSPKDMLARLQRHLRG